VVMCMLATYTVGLLGVANSPDFVEVRDATNGLLIARSDSVNSELVTVPSLASLLFAVTVPELLEVVLSDSLLGVGFLEAEESIIECHRFLGINALDECAA